jgi:hypothetical protein
VLSTLLLKCLLVYSCCLNEMLQLPETSFSECVAVNLCTLLCNLLRMILEQE